MNVVINEFSFLTSVYCKTDDFPFDVISLPFLEGNLSNRICYLVFFGQILRFCRLSTRLEDFIIRVKKLGTILLNRGYQMKLLKREFCRVIEKYRIEFQKWNIPIDCSRFFSDIFKWIKMQSIAIRMVWLVFWWRGCIKKELSIAIRMVWLF